MATSVYDTLYQWARRTTSSWGELDFFSHVGDASNPADGLIYRLKHWPQLPASRRVATVYRALSVMSHRPVNRQWLLAHSRLDAAAVDSLLAYLMAQGALDVTDAAKYRERAEP